MDRAPEQLVKPKGWQARYTVAILGFVGFAMSYALRFNLSLAIISMVKSKKSVQWSQNSTSLSSTVKIACPGLSPAELGSGTVRPEQEGEFEWNEAEQGLILGSFFWGYVATQLLGGILATKYGGKWVLGGGLGLAAVFALITPVAARTHKNFLISVRVVQGLGEGLTTPAMHAILGNWAPPAERSILGSIVYAGAQFGTAATMVVSGYLIAGNVLGGWPSVFYIIGLVSVGWFILWSFLIYDRPDKHPRISKEELTYIEKSIGQGASGQKKKETPWKAIMTSLPFWAIIVGHTGHAWGLYALLTGLPTYLNAVLQFDIKQNSWLSAFPYILMWAVSILSTQLADFLISRGHVKIVWIRKICQSVSQLGPALALVGASFSGCNRGFTVALLTIAVGINGIVYGGYVVNHVDIGSNYSGVLMGITNTFANLCGFGAPYVAGILTNNNATLERWQIVFFIAAAIYVSATIFYVIFASATEQPWNRQTETRQEETELDELNKTIVAKESKL